MHFVLCFWYIPQTRGIMPMMVLKYHVQKLMHVAIILACTCTTPTSGPAQTPQKPSCLEAIRFRGICTRKTPSSTSLYMSRMAFQKNVALKRRTEQAVQKGVAGLHQTCLEYLSTAQKKRVLRKASCPDANRDSPQVRANVQFCGRCRA